MPKPATIPYIDQNQTNFTAPPGAIQTDGYPDSDPLPAAEYNWAQSIAASWLEWIDEWAYEGATSADVLLRTPTMVAGYGLHLSDTAGLVGVGDFPPDIGTGLHVKQADTGDNAIDGGADDLVIEGSSPGLTIKSGTAATGRILFADDDPDRGGIQYNHAADVLEFLAQGVGVNMAMGGTMGNAGVGIGVGADARPDLLLGAAGLQIKSSDSGLASLGVTYGAELVIEGGGGLSAGSGITLVAPSGKESVIRFMDESAIDGNRFSFEHGSNRYRLGFELSSRSLDVRNTRLSFADSANVLAGSTLYTALFSSGNPAGAVVGDVDSNFSQLMVVGSTNAGATVYGGAAGNIGYFMSAPTKARAAKLQFSAASNILRVENELGELWLNGGFTTGIRLGANTMGFYNTAPIAKPDVTGNRNTDAWRTSLMSALSTLGLVTDLSV